MSQTTTTAGGEEQLADERALIISSDGHAVARMEDYRPYIPASRRDEFDDFCELYAKDGARTTDPKSLLNRLDPELVDEWVETVLKPGRVRGQGDPYERASELRDEIRTVEDESRQQRPGE